MMLKSAACSACAIRHATLLEGRPAGISSFDLAVGSSDLSVVSVASLAAFVAALAVVVVVVVAAAVPVAVVVVASVHVVATGSVVTALAVVSLASSSREHPGEDDERGDDHCC